MDHHRVKTFPFFLLLGLCVGCVSHQEVVSGGVVSRKTYFYSEHPLPRIMELSKYFLEWHHGLGVEYHDASKGLVVTEWTRENPLARQRVNLRVMSEAPRTLVSLHLESQVRENQTWREVPSDVNMETKLVNELEAFIRTNR